MWSRRDYDDHLRSARRQLWESRLIVVGMYLEAVWHLLKIYAVACACVFVTVYIATYTLAYLIR